MNKKIYQLKVEMQEKKILQKILWEREREREREIYLFVRENYAKNGRENDKFIIRWCEYEETK